MLRDSTIEAVRFAGHPAVDARGGLPPATGTSDTIVRGVAISVLLLSLIGAGVAARFVSHRMAEDDLVLSVEGAQGMPPSVALTTAALGTFRGLAVDFLWMRADALQAEGQFFEAQTLSQWITTLQPRFPKVWVFQAWNLAYNITAAADLPAERWGWVNRGIELLRNRGIPLNPRSPQLYDQLAWILHNKVGSKLDRGHWLYKARVCRDMQEVLGDMTAGRSTDEVIERFIPIAEAPDTLAELLARHPEVGKVVDLVERHGEAIDEIFLRQIGRVVMVSNSVDRKILLDDVAPQGVNGPLMQAIKSDPGIAKTVFETVLPFLQKQVLADRFRMDATRMLDMMYHYGPLDWRHYDAQSIYWAEEGFAASRTLKRRDAVNELLILRSRLHMLMELVRTGRIEYDVVGDRVDLLPDPRFIQWYEAALEDAFALIDSAQGVLAADFEKAERKDLLYGYRYFLSNATSLAYLYGDEETANVCFRKLVALETEAGRGDQPMYRDTLENFVSIRLGTALKVDVSNTRQFVDAMLQRAMLDGLAKGRLDTFGKFVMIGYRAYEKQYGGKQGDEKHNLEQNKIDPYPTLIANSFEAVMRQASTPLLVRARIWSWAPDHIKSRVWKSLRDSLAEQAAQAGFEVERAFPQPEGTIGIDTSSGEEVREAVDGKNSRQKAS
jgi:hypothetical protein